MFHSIKQLEEKSTSQELKILLWNNRMDLVALSNVKGEVALHRLTWNRVWLLSPIVDGYKVEGLAWRPDGKVLAIAYNSGDIILVNVENKQILHQVKLHCQITCLSWVSENNRSGNGNNDIVHNLEDDRQQYIDLSSKYLPDIPSNTSSFDTNPNDDTNKSNLLLMQDDLTVLLVGTKDGDIYLSIFGCLPASVLNVAPFVKGKQCEIVQIQLSTDFKKTFAIVKCEDAIETLLFENDIFKSRKEELISVARKFQELNTLLNYLYASMSTIKESWENILLEMDSKLSRYASKVPDGILSADFLDLLVFGVCSDEMQEFLLQDLTKKGLEKFGQTIEMSYANIQKLLLKNISKIGPNITYHLSELLGMARFEYKYEKVGLDENQILRTMTCNGAYLSKASEMQQIINDSMINYKAFFRWLYMAIMHLMDERVAPEILKMTQQDLVCITDFLQQFDSITMNKEGNDPKQTGFVMERLGQYLSDEDLTKPLCSDKSEWNRFLMENKCISQWPIIIKHNKDSSLIQQYRLLAADVRDVFEKPKQLISDAFRMSMTIDCLKLNGNEADVPFFTCINTNDRSTLVAFLSNRPPCDTAYIVELNYSNAITARACLVHFRPETAETLLLKDVQFYSDAVLTVLMLDTSTDCSLIYQFPIGVAQDAMTTIDTNRYVNEQNVQRVNGFVGNVPIKHVEGMNCLKISVSGSRKVAVVLSENRRKVRLFEMESEEDDEDDGDVTYGALKDSDTSSIQQDQESKREDE